MEAQPRLSLSSSPRSTCALPPIPAPRRPSAIELSPRRFSCGSPSILKTPLRTSASSHANDEALTPLVSSPPLNITTSSGPICRICHEGDQNAPLISLCHCAGTVGLVHLACIEHWLSASNTDRCELCHDRYVTQRHLRPFKDWVFRSGYVKRSFLGDIACFALLTPLAGISGLLCLHGAVRQSSHRRLWEAIGLMLLAILLFTVYTVWSFLTFRFHYTNWKQWQRENPCIRIVCPTRNVITAIGLQGEDFPHNRQSTSQRPSQVCPATVGVGLLNNDQSRSQQEHNERELSNGDYGLEAGFIISTCL
ncbi:E3 ubiquitin-protein ligase MARCHF2-like [Ornithodoros turicata]|uniref:E3 ubiquitin-protein ligase MARCHF2-like n=1 Tax=Ornithodoros turicata TaxID=34597 RepID=UPI00313A0D9C